MNSRSRRTPFCLSSSSSSYASSPAVSSSSLGSSRLYGRETVLNNDRFPRTSSAYKTEVNQQSSRLLGLSRDYSSSNSRSTSWKLPSSLTSSSRSYDRQWAESSLSSRSKLTDSEGRLGMPSVLLNTTDDSDSKRAKLSYSNRGLYSRTPSTSVTGSTYSSNGLSSGRGTGAKPNDSSWSSCHLLPRSSSSSSKSLLSRRELETKNEASLSGLGEGRIRTPGLGSSLYQTDRVTSTYAQGARPKQTAYSPSSSSSSSLSSVSSSSSSSSSYSSSSTYRESALNRHLSSSTSHRPSPLVRDFNNRTSAPVLNGSSTRHLSREQERNPEPSTDISSSYSSRTSWYTPPVTRAEATLPHRPAPEDREPEGRCSTRRLLSRLFSRRSSQDSSSGSSSVRSLDDDSPSTGGESVDSDEGTRMSSVEPDTGDLEATSGFLRNRRAVLAPIQENNHRGYPSGLAQSRMSSWREAGISSDNNASSGGSSSSSSTSSSWLSSSLRSRCPPLLSRLRRHSRDQSSHSTAGVEDGYSRTQHLLRRWDNPQEKASQDDDEEEEEEEEEEEDGDEDKEQKEEGAVGLEAFDASHPHKVKVETLPDLEDSLAELSPHHRVGAHENMSGSMGPLSGVENQLDGHREKTISSSDQEKLRKIKERLLLEDSDEDEGDLCRICQMGEESASNPLIQPCRCAGSLQYVHQECIKRWLRSKIGSGTNLEAITTCELCKEKLRLNIDNFDIQELYRTHVQSEYDEFLNSGLYLVALLHFCEHFSDVLGAIDGTGLLSLARILHEHMDNLEIPHSESDEEIRDNRPSIEFSDLDDDLEEEY